MSDLFISDGDFTMDANMGVDEKEQISKNGF